MGVFGFLGECGWFSDFLGLDGFWGVFWGFLGFFGSGCGCGCMWVFFEICLKGVEWESFLYIFIVDTTNG